MAAGFPTKANWATGDVLTAAQMNDLAGTANLLAPTAKGSIKAGSAANTVTDVAVGTNNQTLLADSTATGGVKWGASPQTVLTTTGDLLYASAANTPDRLAAGTSGYVLTANGAGAAPTWQALASGGMTSIASGTLSTGSVVISSIPQTYNQLMLVTSNVYTSVASAFQLRLNGLSTIIYGYQRVESGAASQINGATELNMAPGHNLPTTANAYHASVVYFPNYASTTAFKIVTGSDFKANTAGNQSGYFGGAEISTSGITSITMLTSAGTFSGGTYILYGVK